jgi:iron(III) transport system substrate-binding protein
MQLRTTINCISAKFIFAALLAAGLVGESAAQEKTLNLYTARHYSTDESFYTGYTKATGIKINRIEGGEDALFERIKAEGANSPADVTLRACGAPSKPAFSRR